MMIWVSKSKSFEFASNGMLANAGDAVRPISAVPLAEIRADSSVLEPRQDLVADEFVERHAAAAGRAGLHHPRAEHGVALVELQRLDELRQALGAYWPSPCSSTTMSKPCSIAQR